MTKQLAVTVALIAAVMTMPAVALAQSEGLKVHGHWIVEVKNADGSVASRHEFDNALVTQSQSSQSGESLLVAALGRVATLGPWVVTLVHGSGDIRVVEAAAANVFTSPSSVISPSLTVDFPQVSRVVLALRGSATASVRSSIYEVSTGNFPCIVGIPCSPQLDRLFAFTRHLLPTPITLEAGQIVQVLVGISFS